MKNTILTALSVLLLSGCSVVFYGRIGDQKLKDIELSIGDQRSDPNLPAGFIGTLAKVLEAL